MSFPGILHQLKGTGNPHLDRLEEMLGVGIKPAMQFSGKEFVEVSNTYPMSWIDKAAHVFGLILISIISLVAFIVMCVMRNDLKNRLSLIPTDTPSPEERSPAASTPSPVESKNAVEKKVAVPIDLVVKERGYSKEMERLIQFTQEKCPSEISFLDRKFEELEVGDIVVIQTMFCLKQYAVVTNVEGKGRGTAHVEFKSTIPTSLPVSRTRNFPIGTSGYKGIVDKSTLIIPSIDDPQ